MGSVTLKIDGVKDTKNDSRKDKPSDKEGDNGCGDSHDYLFIPRMASEPLKESFGPQTTMFNGFHTHSIPQAFKKV